MKQIKIIHLRDTDAAGVVYFASLLSICHEAYEDSLRAHGINLQSLLSSTLALPITQAEINFQRPLFCGDTIEIDLTPSLINSNQFSVEYRVFQASENQQQIAKAKTVHVCIDKITRQRENLPETLLSWLGRKK